MENSKKKIGITFSCFDLLHAGHIRMLAEAKSQCDYLMVGLQTDPTLDRPEKNKPTQTLVERYVQLSACKYVDEIIPYTTEKDVEDILKLYKLTSEFSALNTKTKISQDVSFVNNKRSNFILMNDTTDFPAPI